MQFQEGMYTDVTRFPNMTGSCGPAQPDVYYYNRNEPHYPPDPCIRPNDGYMMCQPEYPPCPLNYPCMPAAALGHQVAGDVYTSDRSHINCKTCIEKRSYPCASMGPITTELPCPCTHRCPVTLHPKPYDPCLMYPECVNRPATPHFVTPIYNNPTPYIRWSSTSPETKTFPVRCRALFSEHLKCQCPNSAPAIGSNLMMFLQCQES